MDAVFVVQNRVFPLLALPPELIRHILTHLSAFQLVQLARLCRALRQHCTAKITARATFPTLFEQPRRSVRGLCLAEAAANVPKLVRDSPVDAFCGAAAGAGPSGAHAFVITIERYDYPAAEYHPGGMLDCLPTSVSHVFKSANEYPEWKLEGATPAVCRAMFAKYDFTPATGPLCHLRVVCVELASGKTAHLYETGDFSRQPEMRGLDVSHLLERCTLKLEFEINMPAGSNTDDYARASGCFRLVLVQRPEPPPYDSDDEDAFLTEEDLRPRSQGSMGVLHLAQRIGFS